MTTPMESKPNTNHTTGARRRSLRSAALLGAISGVALVSGHLRAGVLQDVYDGAKASTPDAARYELLAAEQNVKTQQLRWMPRVSTTARELWTYQDVSESGSLVFQEGNDNYDVTRVTVEIEQPLFDSTIKPRIDASRARLEQQQLRTRASTEWQTRLIVEGFLKTVRLQALVRSSDRVIARLEKELEGVTKSYDAKVATITDVQNIKLALAGMKRERNNFVQQLRYDLAAMGPSAEALKSAGVQMVEDADLDAIFPPLPAEQSRLASAGILGAEVDEIGHQSAAAARRSLPTVGFYAQYGLDKAGGSVFGGSRDFNAFEVGVVVRWDIFDRGMNRSEAREFTYRQRAKEAELKALQSEHARIDEYGRELLDQAGDGVAELADLVQQHEVLQEASARAYEAGKESYLNSITAYLAYEATLRELITAKHDQFIRHVTFYADSAGWDEVLVQKVDGLFVTAAN